MDGVNFKDVDTIPQLVNPGKHPYWVLRWVFDGILQVFTVLKFIEFENMLFLFPPGDLTPRAGQEFKIEFRKCLWNA